MKKFYLLGLAATLALSTQSCKKDTDDNGNGNNTGGGNQAIEVPEKQSSLLLGFTATWCGPCGASGTPMLKNLAQRNAGKMVAMAIHTGNSELTPYFVRNDTAFVRPMFSQLLQTSGVPINSQGGFSIPAFSLNMASANRNENEINSKVDAKAAEAPVANVGYKLTATADGFTLNTTTKFFKEADGEFSVGVYILEDKVIHRQNVNTAYVPGFEHNNVLRDVAEGVGQTAFTFGETPIATGMQTAGKAVSRTYTYKHPSYVLPSNVSTLNRYNWAPEKTKVAVILWKKDGTKYQFVNGSVSNYLK